MNPTDYRDSNQALLEACLQAVAIQTEAPRLRALLEAALRKSVKAQSVRPVPPLYPWLIAGDLQLQDQPWAMPLAAACACFYAAADLFDDIQDQDLPPEMQAAGPAQAINIANLLLLAAQSLISGLALPDATRLSLLALLTRTGRLMSQGQFLDIHSTNSQSLDLSPEQIIPLKSGAEFACFFAVMPLAAGQIEPDGQDAFSALGHAFGALLQIFTDFADIWVPQPGQRLSQDLAVHKNSFPLYWARADQDWGETVALSLAGRAAGQKRQFELRRLLAQTQALECFERWLDETEAQVVALFDQTPLPTLQTLWDEAAGQARALLDAVQTLRARTRSTPAALRPVPAREQSLQQALDYLDFIPEYRDVWEVQRWGFLGEPLLLGNLFNPLLVLESLLESGREIATELATVLARRRDDGWHYYTGSERIPPDTDDLGQILHLAGRTRLAGAEALLERPLQMLAANLQPSGFCPTWLSDGERYLRTEIDKTWFGNDCPGVMANLYYGLACFDPAGFRLAIARGAQYLIGRFDPDQAQWPGAYYPSARYVGYLVARLLAHLGLEPPCLAQAQARLLDEQALDGSWDGQPQSTAHALLFLHCQTPALQAQSEAARERGQRFLLDTQDYDGSWPAEDFFIRPGREGRFEAYAHPKLSTAFAVRALAASRQEARV